MADTPTRTPHHLGRALRYLAGHVATGRDFAGTTPTLAEHAAEVTAEIAAAEHDGGIDSGQAARARAVVKLLEAGVPIPGLERVVLEPLVDDVVEFRSAVTVFSAETIMRTLPDVPYGHGPADRLERLLTQMQALRTVPPQVDAAPDAEMTAALDAAIHAVRLVLPDGVKALPLPGPWVSLVASGTCHAVDRKILPGAAYRNLSTDAGWDEVTPTWAREAWSENTMENQRLITGPGLLIELANVASTIHANAPRRNDRETARLLELQGRAAQLVPHNPGLGARVAGVAIILAADPAEASQRNVAAQAATPAAYGNFVAHHRNRTITQIRAGVGPQRWTPEAHTMSTRVSDLMLSLPAALEIGADTDLACALIDQARKLRDDLTREIDTVLATTTTMDRLDGLIGRAITVTAPVTVFGADLAEDAAAVATGADVMGARGDVVPDSGENLTTTTDFVSEAQTSGLG